MILNDIHSRLNASVVRRVVTPRSVADVRDAIARRGLKRLLDDVTRMR